jgi:hypothetical protein
MNFILISILLLISRPMPNFFYRFSDLVFTKDQCIWAAERSFNTFIGVSLLEDMLKKVVVI